jgi:tRNA G10  N-methylase Trm11
VLIVDNTTHSVDDIVSKASQLWWTIKIMEIFSLSSDSFEKKITEFSEGIEWKFRYGVTSLWQKRQLKTLLIWLKKSLKAAWVSSRFVNKNFVSLNSAQIIGENLVKRGTDFSIIDLGNEEYLWRTLWVQDIYAYSKRDYEKSRDMQVWMLPPKLSQMMLNLAGAYMDDWCSVYDPFVWLWTLLIEAWMMWYTDLFWSDLNERMVETSQSNTSGAHIEKLNAKFVNEATFWEQVSSWIIVTEWYLGEVMTKKNIHKDRILEQRTQLAKLYTHFFESLKKGDFTWTLVISFPFWEIRWKYFYFLEIYEIISEYCYILPFFPDDFDVSSTKKWSLLYKRDKQLVWREIFRLEIK